MLMAVAVLVTQKNIQAKLIFHCKYMEGRQIVSGKEK